MNSKVIRSYIRVFAIFVMFLAPLTVTAMPVHAAGIVVNIEIGVDGNVVGGSNTGTGYSVTVSSNQTSIKITQNITLIVSNPNGKNIEINKDTYTTSSPAKMIYIVANEYTGGDTDSNSDTRIVSGGTISGGTFSGTLNNIGKISGGTFTGDVDNSGTISGGTFSGDVYVDYGCTISGGTFNGSVTNEGTISGGAFSGSVTNDGTISGGIFNAESSGSSSPISSASSVQDLTLTTQKSLGLK